GKGAHLDYKSVLEDFPAQYRGKTFPALPYTAWQLLEHLRLAQWDILEFSRDEKHLSPKWPEGYWPSETAPPDEQAWDDSVNKFLSDLKAMQELVNDSSTNLYQKIPHGSGQNILREAILVIDHNAYHLGQLVMLRKVFEGTNNA
ncbi:MAG: DinB family protein, partial [bacterium]